MQHPDPNTQPRIVFAGHTESKRHGSAELITYEDGETLIVTKVFMPVPDGFHDDFSEEKGIVPGGAWEILPPAEGSEGSGALFKTQAYSLQFAAWLSAALATAVEVSGANVLDKVTVYRWDGDAEEIEDLTLSALDELTQARAESARLRALVEDAHRFLGTLPLEWSSAQLERDLRAALSASPEAEPREGARP